MNRRTVSARLIVASIAGLSVGSIAAAQSGAPAAVVDIAFDQAAVWSGVHRYRVMVQPKDSAQRDGGTWIVSQQSERQRGRAVVRRAITYRSAQGMQRDTILFDRQTLAPIWQHWDLGSARLSVQFDGRRVSGTVTPRDSAARTMAHQLDTPVFIGAYGELVVQALPLATGYHIILPFYQYETGTSEQDTVQVERSEQVRSASGPRAAWVATFRDPYLIVTYWIDRQNRQLLRWESTQRRTGAVFRMVPIADAP